METARSLPEAPRRHPGGTQEAQKAPRRQPGGTQWNPEGSEGTQEASRRPQEAQKTPRRHPGGTQEAPRRLPRGTQEAPRRLPRGSQGTQGSKRPLREGRAILY